MLTSVPASPLACSRITPAESLILISDTNPLGRAAERGGQRRARQFRSVVLPAQMRGDNVVQAGVANVAQKRSRLSVVKMPVASAHPLFELRWIWAGRKQRGIMIAFEHQSTAPGQHSGDMHRDAPQIREYAKLARTVAKYILRRFTCIVRHRKWRNVQRADRKRLMVIDQIDLKIKRRSRRLRNLHQR